jgi:transposase InsO family protein
VLVQVQLPEATYYYHLNHMGAVDQDRGDKVEIQRIFDQHAGNYGYRRIHAQLRATGRQMNHKRVQRLMNELGLKSKKFTRKSRYNSYKGPTGKVAKNRVNRRFHTPIPLQKLTTDVTEFKCADGQKLYFSPVMDLSNGEIISYSVSKRPTLEFVLSSLDNVLPLIKKNATYRTTLHSDQGWAYQHHKWVKRLKKNKIFQSMSRKGTCADNASMENFFGLMKQEMYHGQPLVPYEELKQRIEDYIQYYNHDRIKLKLAGLSPVQYRIQTSQFVA